MTWTVVVDGCPIAAFLDEDEARWYADQYDDRSGAGLASVVEVPRG